MKKVLFVNSCLTAGGSERVMVILANEFAQNGYDVTMAVVREKGPDTYQLHPSVKCERFHYGTHNKAIIALRRIIKLREIWSF